MRDNIGLYRGKRKDNGEWIEGYYCCELYSNTHYIMTWSYGSYAELQRFEVIPKTVGEYASLTDKNGKKIFEGDILYDEYNESNCLITFDEGSFCILDDNVSQSAWGCSMNGFEVIGNLRDNPELLRS